MEFQLILYSTVNAEKYRFELLYNVGEKNPKDAFKCSSNNSEYFS